MAGPTVAANAMPSDYAMAMQGFGPQTAAALQHSQYLAQALQSMSQQAQNIRTPVALGSDLAAALLMNKARKSSYADLASAIQADRQARYAGDEAWLNGAGAPPASAPASPAPAPAAPAPTPGAVPPASPQPTPQSTQPAPAPTLSPSVLKTIYGEAGGEGPDGERAVAGVILRRAQESGLTPDQVVSAPHQFEPFKRSQAMADNDPRLQKVAADVAGANAGPYDAFYSPGAQAALGRQPPAWDDGKGVDIGRQRFFNVGYKAPAGMAPQGQPGGQPDYAPQGRPGPLQVSSGPQGTPTPSPSVPGEQSPPTAGSTGAPPAAASPAAGGAAPQLLHAPVTDAEKALAARYLRSSYPQDQQLGHQMIFELQRREAAAIEPKVQIQDGRAISYNPYDPSSITSAAIPGMRYGAPQDVAGVAGKFQLGPNGQYTKIGDAPYGAPGATPGVQGVTQVGPDGKVNIIGQGALPAERVLEMRGKFFDSEIYKKFSEARAALNGFRGALAQNGYINNGVLNTAAVDSYIRTANPGASAKNATVSMFLQHLGLPQEVQGHILALTGNGYLTPQTLQQMDQVMQSYVAAHGTEVQNLSDSDAALAKGYGLDPKALGEVYGEVPQPMTLRFAGQPNPAQAGASARQTAATAGAAMGNVARNTVAPPQPGTVVRGYRFLGGDPKNPASWQRVG